MRLPVTALRAGCAASFSVAVVLSMSACGSSSPGTSKQGASAGGPARTTVVNGIPVKTDPTLAAKLPGKYKAAIKIVTSAPYPPFEAFDANQKLIGLDIDTGRAIAAVLGTKAQFSSVDYNGVIPALQAGKYDMVLADIGDTPEREKVLDFVDYSKQGELLVVPGGNPGHLNGLQDMCGKTLAVESGDVTTEYFKTVGSYCQKQHKSAMRLKELPKTSDALLSLKSGQVAAVYLGIGTAADLKTHPDGKDYDLVTAPGKPYGYLPRWVGAGIPKNSSALRDSVQEALTKLAADGTLNKLYSKYGQQRVLVPQVVVNKIVEEPLLP